MARIYIAGKMTGEEDGGKKVFTDADKKLHEHGWSTVNPYKLGTMGMALGDPYFYPKIMKRDFEVLRKCDAIYMTAGWELSPGACCEHAFAKLCGMKVFYEVPRIDIT